MSYEAWGDDDDGCDGIRETYRQTLLEDGWLDDIEAEKLRAQLAAAEQQIAALSAERDRLREALRMLVIGSGRTGGSCARCGSKWLGKNEIHAPNCLAIDAAREAKP